MSSLILFSTSLSLSVSVPRCGHVAFEEFGAAIRTAVGEITLRGVKVLFVDDEADTREMIRRLLEERGADVAVAECADEGVSLLQKIKPDVLISDIGMPGEDGYAMIRRIRELPPEIGGHIPAVALTAYSRLEDRTRAMLSGYQYHLAKPIEISELVTTIGMISQRLPKSVGNGAKKETHEREGA